MRINNNVSALNAWRNLTTTNSQMGKSLEKLSSGFRINRAADDASGLVISQSLRAQISGLKQATRNAQDGISVVQTAEGALNEVHSMLNRMRDLAVQSANTGTVDLTARNAAQAEFAQLRTEIDRIATSTSFGSQKLLDGTFGTMRPGSSTVATAASATVAQATPTFPLTTNATTGAFSFTADGTTHNLTIAAGPHADHAAIVTAINAAIDTAVPGNDFTIGSSGGNYTLASASGVNFTLSGDLMSLVSTGNTWATTNGVEASAGVYEATFQVGAYSGDTIAVEIGSIDATGLGLSSLDVSTAPATAITSLDAAINSVSTLRGELGAVQNRFESTINNLQVTTENLAASESRIRDTDMAAEMTQFTKHQVLLQAGTAMLGQANSLSQAVLSLLQ